MDRKNLNSGICYSKLPESYIKPESKGRRLSEVSECENIPTIDLGSGDSKLAQQIGDACKCFGFFQVIDHGMSLEEVEKTLKVARKFCRLPVEEKLKRYSAQKFVPDAQQILLPSVENQSILWAMGTTIVPALYYCRIASGSPFCEFEVYTVRIEVDSLIVLDLNGGFNNKGFKSSPIGFYPKGEHTVFQKTKYMKCSKGGRAENIRPSHIRRLRRRSNKDDEEDGEDNRRPSDSNSLSLILLMVLLLMVLLIVLSLILWLMS